MLTHPEHPMQQPLTPEELRQRMLAELEACKQAITELSGKQLEVVSGGFTLWWRSLPDRNSVLGKTGESKREELEKRIKKARMYG